jgi:mono/diheme cytochrome c family protein
MRFSVAVLAFAGVHATVLGGALTARAIQDAPKTTWDGAYSEAQAKRGEALYSTSCASCHAPDLSGIDAAPSLTGSEFNAGWNDLTLDDLFERMRTTMPADGPGSLERQQYADILSFILMKDGFPAGSGELPPQNQTLKGIKFVAQKP